MPEEQLLDTRICDLPVRIEGTWLEGRVAELHRELAAKGLPFAPHCYLADEWLTPEDEPVIGIPFYLAHPRLVALEKKMMLEAEGETPEWCMKLLRHEAGHALSYAYGLHRKRSWQKVFGHSSQPYEETYRFRPYSKSYVRHLDNYYAQYHPDEDFVETFAVWLTPGLDWRQQYRGWKALEKLEFVDRLLASIAGQPPVKARGRLYWSAARIRRTLRAYYRKRRHAEAEALPDFHDANLKRMFAEGASANETRTGVARLLQSHKRELLANVAEWTGESRYMASEVVKAIHARAKALRLVTAEPDAVAILKLATYVTTLLMNYRHTNRLRGHV
ncbi:MAG: putative zinc-binding metallopeptidase [Halobacteriales archaeon]|nr:putative zinc-binding metallopeptidase [Halobacteriales archaeon]